jgi:HD-GYP domain-containing protein (c-di-GMP phosphodiesterase class II)
MAFRRLRLSDLTFGKPLPWVGASAPAPARPATDTIPAAADAGAAASVLQCLNQINRRLDRVLMELRDVSSADTELRAIASDLIGAVARDTDISLAAIFLNQIVGSYAIRHCTETAIVVCLIARAMDKTPSEVLIVTAAALTMNVGMVRQTELFQGRDGALSSEERAIVRRHPNDSVDMLRYAGIADEEWLDLVLLHHENDDGSGYPQGRLGDEISQNAKLIGLADRYCAFVSARNYRRSLLPPLALKRLKSESEMPIDQEVVAHFTQMIGPYPPGTLVRLENGETGVVSGRIDAHGALAIHVLRGGDGTPFALAERRSSLEDGCAIEAALEEDHARLRFTMKHIWGELASL